jgi:alpha-mannosidase
VDLSEYGFGVALMGDAACPVSAGRGELRMDLVGGRSARESGGPFGNHRVTWALLPHDGDHRDGRVAENALELSAPLQIVGLASSSGDAPGRLGLFEFDRPGLAVDAVKRSADGKALVLRLHEGQGGRGEWTLRAGFEFRDVHLATLAERPLRKLDHAGAEVRIPLGPHEIVTLRFALG